MHVLALLACLGSPARAAGAVDLEPGAPPLAVQRYRIAAELYAEGQLADSLTELQVAYAMFPTSPKLAFNIARINERLGNLGQAVVFYRRYLELAPAAPDHAAVAAVIAHIEARLATAPVAVVVETEPPGAEIRVDGAPDAADRAPATIQLTPGAHRLELRADGRQTTETSLVVEAGVPAKVRVALPAVPREPPPPPSAPPPAVLAAPPPASGPPAWATPTGWAAVGLGAAGLGAGVWFVLQARGTADEIDDLPSGDRDRYDVLAADVDDQNGLAAIGFVSGAVFAAGGALLLAWPFDDAGVALVPGPAGGVGVVWSR